MIIICSLYHFYIISFISVQKIDSLEFERLK